eukprot:7183265-Prymnesium_polylepis.2
MSVFEEPSLSTLRTGCGLKFKKGDVRWCCTSCDFVLSLSCAAPSFEPLRLLGTHPANDGSCFVPVEQRAGQQAAQLEMQAAIEAAKAQDAEAVAQTIAGVTQGAAAQTVVRAPGSASSAAQVSTPVVAQAAAKASVGKEAEIAQPAPAVAVPSPVSALVAAASATVAVAPKPTSTAPPSGAASGPPSAAAAPLRPDGRSRSESEEAARAAVLATAGAEAPVCSVCGKGMTEPSSHMPG